MNQPLVVHTSPLRLIPIILTVLAFLVVATTLWPGDSSVGFLIGAVAYTATRRLIGLFVLKPHRLGMRAYGEERFEEALTHFEQSYDYFSRHAWVDRWKTILLQSPSLFSYRQISLLNIASCHLQSGRVDEARQTLNGLLDADPDCKYARQTLQTIDSIQQASLPESAAD